MRKHLGTRKKCEHIPETRSPKSEWYQIGREFLPFLDITLGISVVVGLYH